MKTINPDFINEVKEVIQSANINFIIGAGGSSPYLPLLMDIEEKFVKAKSEAEHTILCREYFNNVMFPNLDILNSGISLASKKKKELDDTIFSLSSFFKSISSILLKRKSTLLSKQANVFTTNIDIFMELVLEELNIEFNDGFCGILKPKFDPSNFKKSYFKRSLHFELLSEIPTINVIKLHGSLTWLKDNSLKNIEYSKLSTLDSLKLISDDLLFSKEYEKLLIINPEKKKLEDTVLDTIYYDLLRIFSEELEKESTVLFVIGFSINDEHLRDLIFRSINSNPTLKVYVFCYDFNSVTDIRKKIETQSRKYDNIEIVEPEDNKDESRLDLNNITELLFKKIIS